jgi:multidrug resistance efflux pump
MKYFLALAAVAGLSGAGCSATRDVKTVIASANTTDRAALSPVASNQRVIRATGLVRALEWQMIRAPQISGTSVRLVLTKVIANGSRVAKGDTLIEFDRTSVLDDERDAKAKLDDYSHQLDDKRAAVKSDAAKREAAIGDAEADLAKAQLELRKGPILSDIDRLKNEAKAMYSKQRVESLKKADQFRRTSETAAVRVLELKLGRQQVVLERTESNLDKLQIKALQDGMIALENTWHNGSMGPSREGDQVWPGVPLMRIFNPAKMVVEATVNEPDVAALTKSVQARLYLDAYPGVTFQARLQSASPVATAGVDSPVRTFGALFAIDQQDPRLLPDLSAALEIDLAPVTAPPSVERTAVPTPAKGKGGGV